MTIKFADGTTIVTVGDPTAYLQRHHPDRLNEWQRYQQARERQFQLLDAHTRPQQTNIL